MSAHAEDLALVWPAADYLDGYTDAVQRGWSPDTRRPQAAGEDLARIAADPVRFVLEQVDRDAKGPPIVLPDGSTAVRLPGYALWMWDGEFCGSIGFRWQPGTPALPRYCPGHIGYTVVPWKRRRGYATRALQLMLPLARREGLPFVELVTTADNIASQRVIELNGGVIVEHFWTQTSKGLVEGLRFRIPLPEPGA